MPICKIGLPPLSTFASDVSYGFPTQPMLPMLMYDSEPAVHHSCCRSSKQDGSISSGTARMGRLPRHIQSPTYVDSQAAQGLEAPLRTSTSHLALDPRSRPSSAQTTDSTQHGDWLRIENGGGNSWKRLCSSQGLTRDDDDLILPIH